MPLSTGTSGAVAELEVSADLLLRGFEVFRALSPSCSCDLIAQTSSHSFRIQVRTGYVRASDGEYCASIDEQDSCHADILAIVVRAAKGMTISYKALKDEVESFFETAQLPFKTEVKTIPLRNCDHCGTQFAIAEGRATHQRFCKVSCRNAWHRKAKFTLNSVPRKKAQQGPFSFGVVYATLIRRVLIRRLSVIRIAVRLILVFPG